MGEEGIIASERAPLIYPTYKPQNSTDHKVSYPLVHFDTEISFQDPILIYIVFGKYCRPHYKWGDWYEIHKYHCGCTLYSNPQCITSEVYVVGYRVLLLDNNKVGLRDPYLSYLRSFHLRFKYSTLFLEIETNKIEIVSSLHIIVTLCIFPHWSHPNRTGMWKGGCKNNSLHSTLFPCMMVYNMGPHCSALKSKLHYQNTYYMYHRMCSASYLRRINHKPSRVCSF